MRLIAFFISLVVAALGAVGVVSPRSYLTIIRKFESPAGLSAAGAIRVALGASLYFSAVASRVSKLLRTMGVFTFITGLLTPFLGVRRVSALIAWWSSRGSAFMRVWAVSSVAVGLLLAWAVAPWIRKELLEEVVEG